MVSGSNFGIPILSRKKGFKLSSKLPSVFSMLPNPLVYENDPVFSFEGKRYRADEVGDLFDKLGIRHGSAKADRASLNMRRVLDDPNVPTYLGYGMGTETERMFFYTREDMSDGPFRTKTEDGDDTVSLRSALAPMNRWKNVSRKAFPHKHGDLIKYADVYQWAMKIALKKEE